MPSRRRPPVATVVLLVLAGTLFDCGRRAPEAVAQPSPAGTSQPVEAKPRKRSRPFRVVHVLVPLCDNRHQGIVRVPAKLGDGQDPKNNLYWGAMYGVDTFFARSPHWRRVGSVTAPEVTGALAWSAFLSVGQDPTVLIVMCAYDGRRMKETLLDFLNAAAGGNVKEIEIRAARTSLRVQIGGYADMVCFTGHNGLMDVKLDEFPKHCDEANPQCAVVLACKSHIYFKGALREAKCPPLITTSGFMAPEAYTLDAIVRSWAAGDDAQTTRTKAAAAYAKYQKCSRRAAERLFVAGWGDGDGR